MPTRFPLLDFLKALAAQMVLLHHLVAYGPVSDAFFNEHPELWTWLFNEPRIIVQIFLVISGFLLGRSLINARNLPEFKQAVLNRYLRLVLPYLVALALAMVCAWFARGYLDDDFVPEVPGLGQTLAHMVLLHKVLGFDSLSSGVWYVAIDFQLFVMGLAIFHLTATPGGKTELSRGVALVLCAGLGLVSLFYFNLDRDLDNFGIYFFGSYSLGILVSWISQRARPWPWLMLLMLCGGLALEFAFRSRIALALFTATMVFFSTQPAAATLNRLVDRRWIGFLGQTSYSLFLVHFSLILVGNALFAKYDPSGSLAGTTAFALIWGCAMVASYPFHRWIEQGAGKLRFNPGRFFPRPAPAGAA